MDSKSSVCLVSYQCIIVFTCCLAPSPSWPGWGRCWGYGDSDSHWASSRSGARVKEEMSCGSWGKLLLAFEVIGYDWISQPFHRQRRGAKTLRWDGKRGPEVASWYPLPRRVSRKRHDTRKLPGPEPRVSRDGLRSFPDPRLRQAREIWLTRSRDKPLGVASRRE